MGILTIQQLDDGTRRGELRWQRGDYGTSLSLHVDRVRYMVQHDPPRLFTRTEEGLSVKHGVEVAALVALVTDAMPPIPKGPRPPAPHRRR